MVFLFLWLLFTQSSIASGLEITGKAGLLMDAQSGQIYWEKNSQERLPIASVTKIMNLVLILEAVSQGQLAFDAMVSASEYAASMRGSRIWLEEGEQLPLSEMLYAIAVGSGNDAAVAVAEFMAGSEQEFVKLMNTRAAELGLTNTIFSNASGLPPADGAVQEMTAYDVAILAKHAITVPHLLDFVSTYEHTMRKDTTRIPQLWNYNKLLRRYQGVDGIKTGFTTDAGYCMAATAVRDELRLIAIVLGSSSEANRESDIRALFDYGFRKYHRFVVEERGKSVTQLTFRQGNPLITQAVLLDDLKVTIERGRESEITTKTDVIEDVKLPLTMGTVVGKRTAYLGDEILGSVDLTVSQEVQRGSIFTLIIRMYDAMIQSLF